MRKNVYYKLVSLFAILLLTTSMIGESGILEAGNVPEFQLVYDNIWGTIYHPVSRQCGGSPTITGDGSHINVSQASKLRWIAISQEMLKCEYRQTLLNDPNSPLFKGEIQYGDTIWIESPYDEINGWWVVHDAKNKRYTKSIDFLQSVGDGSLYKNDIQWSGKFNGIRIYKRNPYYKNNFI